MRADTARIRNTEQELESIRLKGMVSKERLMEKRILLKRLIQTDRGIMYGYRLEEQTVRLAQELSRLDSLLSVLSEVRMTYERTEEQILRGDRRTRKTIRTAQYTARRAFGEQAVYERKLAYPAHLPMTDTRDTREAWETVIKS